MSLKPARKSNVVTLQSNPNDHGAFDSEALGRLMGIYREDLRRDLKRYITLQDDIEDAIQETFYRVLRGGRIEGLKNPQAFLYKTARNILFDRYRKRRLEKNADDNIFWATNSGAMEDTYLEYSEMELAYKNALNELPRKCRQVFLMRRYDGLTNSEIADALGISMRMVQKHMIKALKHFSNRLR